jgi:hypothetical protein
MGKSKEMPWMCYGCGKWVTALKEFWSADGYEYCQYCPHCIAAIKDSYRLRKYQGHA